MNNEVRGSSWLDEIESLFASLMVCYRPNVPNSPAPTHPILDLIYLRRSRRCLHAVEPHPPHTQFNDGIKLTKINDFSLYGLAIHETPMQPWLTRFHDASHKYLITIVSLHDRLRIFHLFIVDARTKKNVVCDFVLSVNKTDGPSDYNLFNADLPPAIHVKSSIWWTSTHSGQYSLLPLLLLCVNLEAKLWKYL